MTASLMAFMRGLFSSLFSPAARTASANGTGVDLVDYDGGVGVYLDSAAGTGTTPTLDFKLQESDDNTTFTDIATANVIGGAFVQVVAGASTQTRYLDIGAVKRYVRGVATIGGTTPSFTFAVSLVGQKKYQS